MYNFDGGLWSRKDYVFMKHEWMKWNYIPVLNVLLITDSLRLQKICILKKTISKGAYFAFGVKRIS